LSSGHGLSRGRILSEAEARRRLRLIALRFDTLEDLERVRRAAARVGFSPHRFCLAAIERAVSDELARPRRKEAAR
jgi:hypothetical protein